jgi:hypothetical protein
LFDPATQHGDLVGRQLLATLFGGHLEVGVVVFDSIDQVAFIGPARHDRWLTIIELGKRPVAGVEPQFGFALLVVGAVAGEAVVRKDRADVPRETQWPRGGGGRCCFRISISTAGHANREDQDC